MINYKEYPENWFTEIRPTILKRANNCCEECGVKNYSIRGKTKIVLTIAHLDHDHKNINVSLSRLKALCQKCHLKLDLPRHIENRKYGRHWRKFNYKLDL